MERGYSGGDDIPEQVVASFLEQGPQWLAEICKALTTGDVGSLALAAHDLAGASSVLGAGLLGQHCVEVEALARRGEIDTVGERLPSLMAAWEHVVTELRALYSLATPQPSHADSLTPFLTA